MFPNEIQTKPTKKNSKCHCTSFNHHQKNTHTHTHSHHKMRYFCHPIPLFILSLILFILFAALKRKFTTIFHITYIMLYVILCCCCRLPLHIIFLCFIICLLNVCIITLRNIYYIDIYFPQKKKSECIYAFSCDILKVIASLISREEERVGSGNVCMKCLLLCWVNWV